MSTESDTNLKLDIGSLSVKGRRSNNQDRVLAINAGDSFVLAVADGMGGASGGEIASSIVIETVKRLFNEFAERPEVETIRSCIESILRESQHRIKRRISDDPTLSGMGTTLTIVLGVGNEYLVGNIGDSRAYRYSSGRIEQITKDNSLLQQYLDNAAGDTSAQEEMRSFDHILTRSVTASNEPIDIYSNDGRPFVLSDQEILLLCSDGLIIDKLDREHADFSRILTESRTPAVALNTLIEWAYERGSSDNISAVVCSREYWSGFNHRVRKPDRPRGSIWIQLLAASIAVVVVLLIMQDMRNVTSKEPVGSEPKQQDWQRISGVLNDTTLTGYPNCCFGPFTVFEPPPSANSASEFQTNLPDGTAELRVMIKIPTSPGVMLLGEPIEWWFDSVSGALHYSQVSVRNPVTGDYCDTLVPPGVFSINLDRFNCVSAKNSYQAWISVITDEIFVLQPVVSETITFSVP